MFHSSSLRKVASWVEKIYVSPLSKTISNALLFNGWVIVERLEIIQSDMWNTVLCWYDEKEERPDISSRSIKEKLEHLFSRLKQIM